MKAQCSFVLIIILRKKIGNWKNVFEHKNLISNYGTERRLFPLNIKNAIYLIKIAFTL